MNWEDIINETGIEVIWVGRDYSQDGAHFPKCSLYPNGAIILRIDIEDFHIESVALHEIGHIVDGEMLDNVNRRLKHLKNECKANRYMLKIRARDFISSCDESYEFATPHRLCSYVKLALTTENIMIAEQAIYSALHELNLTTL